MKASSLSTNSSISCLLKVLDTNNSLLSSLYAPVLLNTLLTPNVRSCKLMSSFIIVRCLVLEFFDVIPIALDRDRHLVIRVSHGVYPSFVFTCKGFFYVLKSVADVLLHDLMYSVGIKYACDSPIES